MAQMSPTPSRTLSQHRAAPSEMDWLCEGEVKQVLPSFLLSDCTTSAAPNRPHCALCNTNSIHSPFLIWVCTYWAIFITIFPIYLKQYTATLLVITLFIFVHIMYIRAISIFYLLVIFFIFFLLLLFIVILLLLLWCTNVPVLLQEESWV